MTQHDRFRRIERPRPDAAPESQSADRARIAAVIEASPVSVPPDAVRIEVAVDQPAGTGRPPEISERMAELADTPAPAGALDLAIDTAVVQGQPFVRCARCRCDSTIHATACDNCGVALDTDEQRAFNDRLWSAQKLQNEREREALAQMAEARAEARRTARPLPEPGAMPPPELLEPLGDSEGPLLFSMLRSLQDKRARWAVGAMVVGLPLLLVALGSGVLSALGWILLLLCGAAMLPRRIWRWIDVKPSRGDPD